MLRFAIDRNGFDRSELVKDMKAALGNETKVKIDSESDEDYIYISTGDHNESDYDIVADWWFGIGSKKKEAL